MIFSKGKWNDGAEIKDVVKVSKSISFEMMETPLRNAWNKYIVPILGSELKERIIKLYAEFDDYEDKEKELLTLCQRANANLALYDSFDEINTRITDAGFQRQETESFKQAYKYQEDNLRNGFKNKGYNAIDDILNFLNNNITEFPEFKSSQAYIDYKFNIVKSAKDIDMVFFIHSSRIVYLQMQPHLKFVEENMLPGIIGDRLFDKLHEDLKNESLSEDDKKISEKLRRACSHYICCVAVRRILMQTGNITDRGLYFSSIECGSNASGNETLKPVDTDRLSVMIQNLQCDIDTYIGVLNKLIRNYYSEYYSGDPKNVFDRDNDDKQIFFA